MKLKTLILTICLALLTQRLAFTWTEEVQLVTNELKIIPVQELKRVAIGDPAVADMTILSAREVMLMAKSSGTTSLIIWDASGQRSFNITVLGKDLEKIAQKIRELLVSSDIQGVTVKAQEDGVYVTGEVLTQYELDKVKSVLAPFATNTTNLVRLKERQPLVEIDVNVLEVACDDVKRLGFDWSNLLPITYTEPSGTRTAGSSYDPKSHITGKAPKLWRTFKWDRSTIDARLNFLIEEGKARTLSNPKLVTLSGKEASFLVGGETPYVTVETEGRTKVEWKEYGINLKILPEVNTKNEIRIVMNAEVSDLGSSVLEQGYSIPSVTTRKAQTELFLNEEDTIFLAGLIRNRDSENIDRLPWLSKVPILGEMFKYNNLTDTRTELVISLTPRIIGEKADFEYIASEMLKQEAILAARSAYTEEVSPLDSYNQMIEDIITNAVVYPEAAREVGLEGMVKIELRLLSDGRLKEAKIRESSGFSTLDRAALAAVQAVDAYPSFPSQIAEEELLLSVPVVFESYTKGE
ncbi:MAG: TonB family protein [Candidatus Omnitrophota bacterium]|nr:MAG: TonB family protein [Candidatus Omnitrophota bacterium]